MPNTTEGWQVAVARLVKDRDLRSSLARRAYEEAGGKFSIDRNLGQYQCVVQLVAEGSIQ